MNARLRLAISRFWQGCTPELFAQRHPELSLLDADIVDDVANADVIVYSVFGDNPLPTGPKKVFYSGENVTPLMQVKRRPFEKFEYALTFSRKTYDFTIHKRLPNYCVAGRHLGYELNDLTAPRIVDDRSRFCCFLHGNSVPFRENFVRQLSKYKRVDCPGRSLNNMDLVVSKSQTISFLAQYKFMVCFENERGDGYVTEKIVNAYRAGCVPIYWGDPLVVADFHPGSMINANSFSDFDQLVSYVAWLDQNAVAYRSLRSCPPLFGNQIPPDLTVAAITTFWRRIFESCTRREQTRES